VPELPERSAEAYSDPLCAMALSAVTGAYNILSSKFHKRKTENLFVKTIYQKGKILSLARDIMVYLT
jgi:hypothetical protein